MKIETIPASKLKSADYNPRQWTDKQIKDLKQSISEFGLVEPLIVNKHKGRENIVVGGHFRLNIAKQLGIKEIPVVYVDLSLKKERELNIRLNKNVGEWDFDALANEFDLEDLKEFGFDQADLKLLEPEPEEDDFDVEANKPKKPKSKKGEIYELGRHRLMCGDSTSKEDVEKLMDGKKADMVFTDPPYGVGFKYNEFKDTNNKQEHAEFSANWWKVVKQYSDFIIVTPGFDNEYIFFNLEPSFAWLTWYKKFGISASRIAFARRTELIFVYGKPPVVRYDTDYFEYGTDREKGLNDKHPCPKPLKLINALVSPQTDSNSIVLDVFGGSGSTLIACEQTGRTCYMMEIDPTYCDVIIKRYEDYIAKTG